MNQQRTMRAAGETLFLGNTEYHLEAVEGSGGSTIVYRAFYQDGLNRGSVHKVLIKELFPLHPQGLVWRDGEGRICCAPQAEAFMERHRRSFYLGNKANLDLLEKLPERISGNLNSYEAYGTYYSVLPVHGGENLQQILEREPGWTLRDLAQAMEKILDALECFHQNGILHLDISPDNILLLPAHALLIDYNSVRPVQRQPGGVSMFSEKEGYSAPEILLREEDGVGPASDLYSVSAVFFRMLTGYCLSEEITTARGVGRCFPKSLAAFEGEPVSAAGKAVQIVTRGLHILPEKRYPSAAAMREDIRELLRRIDGKGVSFSTIFEESRKACRKQLRRQEAGLPRRIQTSNVRMQANQNDSKPRRLAAGQTAGGYQELQTSQSSGSLPEVFTERECLEALRGGRCLLLTGSGGMGKTRLLQKLWEMGTSVYRETGSAVVYLPLEHYQESGGEPFFIRRWLLRHFCGFGRDGGMEDALQALDYLLEHAGQENGTFVLLMDGLNESGPGRKHLLKEIEELGRRPGIGILVTDRTDSVKRYGLHAFQTARLLPLTPEEIGNYLQSYHIPLPEQPGLLELLACPMLLALYRKGQQLAREQEAMISLKSMEDMIGFYLESLYREELRKASGNEAEQLLQGYLLHHLLPELAAWMKRRKKSLFSLEELYGAVRSNYQLLQTTGFAMAFPDYLGKTRLLLQDIRNEQEWFDYAVAEQLIGRWNLLERDGEGSYRLIHENFTGYLAAQGEEHRKRLRTCRLRGWLRSFGVKVSVGILSAAVITAAGLALRNRKQPAQLTQEEQAAVYSAMQRMELNMGICNHRLQGQRKILEQAKTQGVLNGEPEELRKLKDLIEMTMAEADSRHASYRDGQEHIEHLEQTGAAFPLDEIEELYQKPEELKRLTEHAAGLLAERLCAPDSIYNTYDQRKQLVDTYQRYVSAYARMCGALYSQILYSLQDMHAVSAEEEMRQAASELLLMGEYIHDYGSQEAAQAAVTKARRQLAAAQQDMKRENLYP